MGSWAAETLYRDPHAKWEGGFCTCLRLFVFKMGVYHIIHSSYITFLIYLRVLRILVLALLSVGAAE